MKQPRLTEFESAVLNGYIVKSSEIELTKKSFNRGKIAQIEEELEFLRTYLDDDFKISIWARGDITRRIEFLEKKKKRLEKSNG